MYQPHLTHGSIPYHPPPPRTPFPTNKTPIAFQTQRLTSSVLIGALFPLNLSISPHTFSTADFFLNIWSDNNSDEARPQRNASRSVLTTLAAVAKCVTLTKAI